VDKDGNDLDAVAGNAEDDIGDLIASIRERELLYGEQSLLALYGPLIAHICATPKSYKVSLSRLLLYRVELTSTPRTVTVTPTIGSTRHDQAYVRVRAIL
jgi:hypothetical protein